MERKLMELQEFVKATSTVKIQKMAYVTYLREMQGKPLTPRSFKEFLNLYASNEYSNDDDYRAAYLYELVAFCADCTSFSKDMSKEDFYSNFYSAFENFFEELALMSFKEEETYYSYFRFLKEQN